MTLSARMQTTKGAAQAVCQFPLRPGDLFNSPGLKRFVRGPSSISLLCERSNCTQASSQSHSGLEKRPRSSFREEFLIEEWISCGSNQTGKSQQEITGVISFARHLEVR